jgi:hypothetical protein
MQKLTRSFALVAVLTLTLAPALNAEQGGNNPHPGVVASTLEIVASAVLSYLGL